jgi:fibronectin type 3 domain-containing protein
LKARGNQGSVRLTWAASATAGVTYNVYRGTASGGEVVYKTGVSGTQYTDNDVQSRVAYYYRVTAVNATGGESQPSNEASALAR